MTYDVKFRTVSGAEHTKHIHAESLGEAKTIAWRMMAEGFVEVLDRVIKTDCIESFRVDKRTEPPYEAQE